MQWILSLLLLHAMGRIMAKEKEELRVRRQILPTPPLVYPYGGNFKLVLGFAVPVHLSGRILVYGQNFQFQYALPPNATFFTNFFENAGTSRRRRRNTSTDERIIVYKLLEQELRRKNVDGQSCVQKSICEAAATPLKDEGLIGELLHLLLTPDKGDTSTMDLGYLHAAEAGKRRDNCSMIYSMCPEGHGIMDKFLVDY